MHTNQANSRAEEKGREGLRAKLHCVILAVMWARGEAEQNVKTEAL